MPNPPEVVEISNPEIGELEETLRLAFGHMASRDRERRLEAVLPAFHAGTASLESVFQAKTDGKTIGALFSQKRPDGTVLLWAPVMTDGGSTAPFFGPLERFCLREKILAALALVDQGQPFDKPSLLQAGFEYLSDLLYLFVSVEEEEPEPDLRFLPMSEVGGSSFDRMVETVRATYRNTRDFPRLLRLMPVRDVLDGYRTGSPFLPELWFFVRKEDRDIGVLLLTDQPEDQMELTYMGLVEEARGRGYAEEVVRFAKRAARLRGRRILLTSVDEQNAAALKSYLSSGFRTWDRKNVYARFFTSDDASAIRMENQESFDT